MRASLVFLFVPWLLSAQGGGGTVGAVSVTGGLVTGQPPGQPPRPEPSQFKPEELCTVEGIVRHSVTGEPLRKASITLMRTDPRPSGGSPPFTTTTNAEGKFAMKNVEPGQYRIMALRPGFVNSESGAIPGNRPSATLTLEKSQSMKGVEIKLIPHSVVTGRITDEDGDPVQGAQISLVRPRYFQGRKQLTPSGFAQSNDLGEYRLFGVAPGKYYVSVNPARTVFNFGSDRSAARQPEETPAPTYYPSSTEVQSASQVNVPLAGSLQGIDVRLRKERAFRVKGKVIALGSVHSGGMIVLLRRDAQDDFTGSGRLNAPLRMPSGEFELAGVCPGSYILRAIQYEQEQQASGTIALEVTDRDVEGLTIPLGPGLEVSGSVRAEADQPPDLESITLQLESRAGRYMMGGSYGRVKGGGAFLLKGVLADHYDLRINGVPQDYYVKSIRAADRDVMEQGLDLSAGASTGGLEVVISPAGSQLEGSVTDAKGNPAKGATVVLRPKSGRAWDLAAMRPTTTDQNGQFRIRGIVPGEYHLIAFEQVDPNEAMDPEFFKEFESKAEQIKLDASVKETRQIKAVDAGPR